MTRSGVPGARIEPRRQLEALAGVRTVGLRGAVERSAGFRETGRADPSRRKLSATSETLHLTVHYEGAGEGWVTAQVVEVPGAISQGRTRQEARENVIDALRTVLTPDEQLAGQPPGADDEPLTLTIA